MDSRSTTYLLSALIVLAILLAAFPQLLPGVPAIQQAFAVGGIIFGLALLISASLLGPDHS